MDRDSRTSGGPENERPSKIAQVVSGAVDLRKTPNGAAGPADTAIRLEERAANDGGAKRPGIVELSRASRSELDRLLAETRAIQERSSKLTQSLMEDLQTQVWRTIEIALSGFQKEIHERASHEASLTLDHLEIEADARLAARVDQALARQKNHQQLVERDLASIAAENQKTGTETSARMAEEMRRCAAILKAEFESEAQAKAGEVKKNASDAIASVQETSQATAAELEKRSGQALLGFESRMAQIEREAIARVENRIDAVVKSALSMIAKQVHDTADRHISRFFVQAFRSRLEQLADAFTQPRDAESESATGQIRVGEFEHVASGTPERALNGTDDIIVSPQSADAGEAAAVPTDRARSGSIDQGYAFLESSFRKDFESRYGAERSYDEYAPAYRFGCGLAAEPQYRGKDWLAIEPDAKRMWEVQSDEKWDKFKGSIQYAWLSALAADRG